MRFWRQVRGVLLGFDKADVNYTDHAGAVDDCSRCVSFRPASYRCAVVRGRVSPNGWCERFEPTLSEGNPWQSPS